MSLDLSPVWMSEDCDFVCCQPVFQPLGDKFSRQSAMSMDFSPVRMSMEFWPVWMSADCDFVCRQPVFQPLGDKFCRQSAMSMDILPVRMSTVILTVHRITDCQPLRTSDLHSARHSVCPWTSFQSGCLWTS